MELKTKLPQKIHRFIESHSLIESPGLLIVGVSGGVDSICLLHGLVSLQDRLGIRLHVAHLNHQLRGAESDADAEYVSSLARQLGIDATVDARDVKGHQKERRCSLEEAAREVRYAFFAEVAESIGADAVAVAHTADDQAETVLMHLIRGTGLDGLSGMRPRTRWSPPAGNRLTVIRPLLETSRQETEAYCTAHELSPRHDSSNESPDHLRNRIRAEVMPLLREYNPSIVETLSRMARMLADDVDYLNGQAGKAAVTLEESPRGLTVDNRAFLSLPVSLQRHLVRRAAGRLLGSTRDLTLAHVEAVLNALDHPAGKKLDLPHGLTFYGDYEKSVISGGQNPLAFLPELDGEHGLNIPGQTETPGWRMTARIIEGRPEAYDSDEMTALLDADVAGTDLLVRARRPGDRFHPLGMDQAKKLQDFMVDARIPRAWRDRVPIVCSADRILWVVGWRIDHRARVTESTRRTLRLDFQLE